jgi:hypothetical protein
MIKFDEPFTYRFGLFTVRVELNVPVVPEIVPPVMFPLTGPVCVPDVFAVRVPETDIVPLNAWFPAT